MKFDIKETMERLSKVRPVFHAESDFQHALAWQLCKENKGAEARLETKPLEEKNLFLDILIKFKNKNMAIECKYLTREFSTSFRGEHFLLRNQRAQNQRRYDVMKDIARIEYFVKAKTVHTGLVVVLTNDSQYWTPKRKSNPSDKEFRLTEGRKVTGELTWGMDASAGTTKGRESPIELENEYELSWSDYSFLDGSIGGNFRYLPIWI